MNRLLIFLPRLLALSLEATSTIVAATMLGVSVVGQYTSAAVFGGVLATVVDGGAASKIQARVRDYDFNSPQLQDLIVARRARAIVVIVCALATAVITKYWSAAILMAAAGTLIERRWYLLQRRDTGLLAVSYLLRPAALLLTILALSQTNVDSAGSSLCLATGTFLALALVARLDSTGGRRVTSHANLRRLGLGFDARLALSNTLGLALPTLSVASLQVFSSAAATGSYALAYRPIQAILVLLALQRDLWLLHPHGLHGRLLLRRLFRLFAGSVSLVLPFVFLVQAVRPFSLLGIETLGADNALSWLAIGAMWLPVSAMLYAEVVAANAPGRLVLVPTLVGTAVGSLAIPALTFWFQAEGAASGVALSECVITCVATLLWWLHTRPSSAQP